MQTTPYIPPETKEEAEQVDLLLEMMGDFVNRTEALRVYRKHKGNVERAGDAILSGDRGEDYNWDEAESSAPPGYSQATQQIGPQPLKPSTTVIDLTGSDEELHRAMAMSLEDEPTFGPSNRPPDPNWAMVPTNVRVYRFYHGAPWPETGISKPGLIPACQTRTSLSMTRSRRVWKTLHQRTNRTSSRSTKMFAKAEGEWRTQGSCPI